MFIWDCPSIACFIGFHHAMPVGRALDGGVEENGYALMMSFGSWSKIRSNGLRSLPTEAGMNGELPPPVVDLVRGFT
jgi:hypothetical protein